MAAESSYPDDIYGKLSDEDLLQSTFGPPLSLSELSTSSAFLQLASHEERSYPDSMNVSGAPALPDASDSSRSAQQQSTADASRPKRPRKEKPRIELAPDQPPTTQGKPRTRVFVACLQCRSRKIRCDGAKPSCHNCNQRLGGEGCDYDSAPKRRGPDRVQGARTRTAKPKDAEEEPVKRRRRRTTTSTTADTVAQAAGGSFSTRQPPGSTAISHEAITIAETNADAFYYTSDTSAAFVDSSSAQPASTSYIHSSSVPPGSTSYIHDSSIPHASTSYIDASSAPVLRSYIDSSAAPSGSTSYIDNTPSALLGNSSSSFIESGSSSFVGDPSVSYIRNHGISEHQGNNQIYAPASSYDPGVLLNSASYVPTYVTTYEEVIPGAYILDVDDGSNEQQQERADLVAEPNIQFSRKVWWDHLLYLYSTATPATRGSQVALTQTQRDTSMRQVVHDLRFLFRSSSYWFSFIHVPRFYNNFLDPERRSRMQPCLVLSALAVSAFLQSSNLGRGREGRRMAIILRDEAQSALDASLSSRAVDEEVAQAAWILAFFEVCAHPQHKLSRVVSSLNILDSVIRVLALTTLDAGNPNVSKYAARSVPALPSQAPSLPTYAPSNALSNQPYGNASQAYVPSLYSNIEHHHQQTHIPAPYAATLPVHDRSSERCGCDSLSLGQNWPEAHEQTPFWAYSPAWNYEWSEGDVRKEECRRLSWSALTLAAGYSSYTAASNGKPLDLFMIEPSNYTLLFPGETLHQPQTHYSSAAGKETVWALVNRCMLLWHSCLRLRNEGNVSDGERSAFAMRAWLESEEIEEMLTRHTCGVERAYMYVGREYLFNTRMCISYEFQRFIPHVVTGLSKEKAKEWLRQQGKRAKTIMIGLHAVTGNMKHDLSQRPWFVWWFMGQASRALTLWSIDHSLTIALDVATALMAPVDFLTSIYPSIEQRDRCERLRERLRLACLTAEMSMGYVPSLASI
ncbi:hypothetical protein BV25DRAFT_1857983 [Artomyces pyxidatus]|uniref:Uncharacterized protein n=1 Tax=Artomyces pyxidatus TaxID=48021 RepID=A0ACB8SXG2_9AGAM|nr:hypothetical protein BV25DRAFT_1857983 [Artomyces pyxidatus]